MRQSAFTITVNNTKVTESCKNMRALAAFSLKGKWLPAIVAVFIARLLTNTIPTIIYGNLKVPETGFDYPGFILNITVILLSGVVNMSLFAYFLAVFRGADPGRKHLLTGPQNFFTAILFGGVQFLLTNMLAGNLIVSVFAVVMILRYSMSYFVFADDPEKGLPECMASSRYVMTDNGQKLVRLVLSFTGWFILSIFAISLFQLASTPGIFEQLARITELTAGLEPGPEYYAVVSENMSDLASSVTSPLIQIISTLISSPVSVYLYASLACFYDFASGKIISEASSEEYSH